METLAAEAGVSRFHFARLFRTSMGLAPHAFLVQLRMRAAHHMLATTELSVAAVVARCGFAEAVHFGKAFTKRFGMSPTAFRAQSRC